MQEEIKKPVKFIHIDRQTTETLRITLDKEFHLPELAWSAGYECDEKGLLTAVVFSNIERHTATVTLTWSNKYPDVRNYFK